MAGAHGGVEKSRGNTIVYLSQEPLSPLVGEEVMMTFVLGRPTGTDRLRDLEVELTVIDTFPDDATKDQVILKETKRTDANGAIEFAYTFTKENFFDVELNYKDPSNNQEEEVGFLVQTRSQPPVPSRTKELMLFLAGGIVLGFVLTKALSKSKTA